MHAAWVSLLSKTEYLAGLLVVDHGLKAVGSKYPLVVMVTESLSQDARNVLHARGVTMVDVGSIRPGSSRESFDKTDARFSDTWSKIRQVTVVRLFRRRILTCWFRWLGYSN